MASARLIEYVASLGLERGHCFHDAIIWPKKSWEGFDCFTFHYLSVRARLPAVESFEKITTIEIESQKAKCEPLSCQYHCCLAPICRGCASQLAKGLDARLQYQKRLRETMESFMDGSINGGQPLDSCLKNVAKFRIGRKIQLAPVSPRKLSDRICFFSLMSTL